MRTSAHVLARSSGLISQNHAAPSSIDGAPRSSRHLAQRSHCTHTGGGPSSLSPSSASPAAADRFGRRAPFAFGACVVGSYTAFGRD